MEYEVSIEVTYKYIVQKIIEAPSEDEARAVVDNFIKKFDRRKLDSEWDFSDEPVFVGDLKIIDVEEF